MEMQEQVTDFILAEKKMGSNYDIFASECVNTQLRDDFLKIFNQGHKTQTDLFQMAQSKGWYKVEQAPANKVETAYQKFSNQKPQ